MIHVTGDAYMIFLEFGLVSVQVLDDSENIILDIITDCQPIFFLHVAPACQLTGSHFFRYTFFLIKTSRPQKYAGGAVAPGVPKSATGRQSHQFWDFIDASKQTRTRLWPTPLSPALMPSFDAHQFFPPHYMTCPHIRLVSRRKSTILLSFSDPDSQPRWLLWVTTSGYMLVSCM